MVTMAVGGRELHALAYRCKQVGDKQLVARLRRGLTAATRDSSDEVRAAFAAVMPRRGGYAALLGRNMRSRTSVRLAGAQAAVELVVWAAGERERRDLPALNRGQLRHPVFGRSRRLANGRRRSNPWSTTTVPPKAFDQAVDRIADRVAVRMTEVRNEIAAAIVGR